MFNFGKSPLPKIAPTDWWPICKLLSIRQQYQTSLQAETDWVRRHIQLQNLHHHSKREFFYTPMVDPSAAILNNRRDTKLVVVDYRVSCVAVCQCSAVLYFGRLTKLSAFQGPHLLSAKQLRFPDTVPDLLLNHTVTSRLVGFVPIREFRCLSRLEGWQQSRSHCKIPGMKCRLYMNCFLGSFRCWGRYELVL